MKIKYFKKIDTSNTKPVSHKDLEPFEKKLQKLSKKLSDLLLICAKKVRSVKI